MDRDPDERNVSSRRAELPPQPDDFVVSVGGRQRGWLSRLVGLVAAPILSWWLKRPSRTN